MARITVLKRIDAIRQQAKRLAYKDVPNVVFLQESKRCRAVNGDNCPSPQIEHVEDLQVAAEYWADMAEQAGKTITVIIGNCELED